MGKKKKKKVRADFRKKYGSRTRKNDFTRAFDQSDDSSDETVYRERVSGKGELTRKRTITGAEVEETESGGFHVHLDIDETNCSTGRVLSVHGLASFVEFEDGRVIPCATRGILKSLSTDQRHVVAAGDLVLVSIKDGEGVIERIEPRTGILSRSSRNRQHVIVANVDQIIIVTSAAEPRIKPNLIDRFLVTAEKSQIQAVVCINKVDLVDAADLQPLVGVFAQLGYDTLLVSAESGVGIEAMRALVKGKQSVVAGQSGVGKSSLLNCIDRNLQLRVSTVSAENQKGRHTTTAARLIALENGGYIVDTPGIRQFQLWDVIPEEVGGFYREIRPYVNHCRFPDCTHQHETDCAVKDAVADGHIDTRRYESYCHLFSGEDYD
jgi:ribosome biogenesis GTPase